MAEQYVAYTITNAGKDIIARVIGGEQITFTKIVLGDGFDYNTANFALRTTMVSPVITISNLALVANTSNVVELTGSFSTSDLSESFYYREIGIYIQNPDDPNEEILFAYGNRNDYAEYITPHITEYAVRKEIKALLAVGVSANVNIIISDDSVSTKITFAESDWTLDVNSGLYTVNVGIVGESLRVFKTTNAGMEQTACVDITRDLTNTTTLRALVAFDGCVICV